MSFYFPKNRERKDYPIDKDAINEDFREVYAETQSGLGEHNWRRGAISNLASMASDAGIKVHRTGLALTHGITNADYPSGSDGTGPQTGVPANNYFNVSPSNTWNVVVTESGTPNLAATMSRTITTGNSLLWIMASFQQATRNATRDVVSNAVRYELGGCNHAISLDSTIIYESMDGGLDVANDPTGSALRMDDHPFVVDVLIPVNAGVHTLSMEIRHAYGPTNSFTGNFTPVYSVSTNNFYQIMSREFIILELK